MEVERATEEKIRAKKEAQWAKEKLERQAKRDARRARVAVAGTDGKRGIPGSARKLKRTQSGPSSQSSAIQEPKWRRQLRRTLSTPQHRV